MISNDEIRNRFTYHAPHGDQPERYEKLRFNGGNLAEMIVDLTPPSREQALALTNLEQAVMWANASIARNETRPEEKYLMRKTRGARSFEEVVGEFLGGVIYLGGMAAVLSWPTMVALQAADIHVRFLVLWIVGMFIVGLVRTGVALDD